MPGPSDYKVVSTNVFLRRGTVIPQGTFASSQREGSLEKVRSISPGPNHYRVKSDVFLKRQPSATIGNTVRAISVKSIDQRTLSPGPADYRTSKPWNGPKFHFAKKYSKQYETSPGPSDYRYEALNIMKKQPKVCIGKAAKVSSLVSRERSPGPQDYEPKRLKFKNRPATFVFQTEKR